MLARYNIIEKTTQRESFRARYPVDVPGVIRLDRENLNGALKWGLVAQLSTIVHFCGRLGPLSKGNFRHKMTTIVGNRGQLWTSTLPLGTKSLHSKFR